MLAKPHRSILVTVLTLSICVGPTSGKLLAAPPLIDKLLSPFKRHGKKPKTQHDPAIETLAKNLDWLEHEIDDWGSITAKTPDVWGEARLTKYRREVEQELSDEVDGFVPNRISGAQAVADSAFLATALALSGKSPLADGETAVTVPNTSISIGNANQSTTATPANGEPASTISINPNRPGAVFGTNNFDIDQQIELEQVQQLDQLKRYLDHLNELRRINEGDDAADAPGYSLNLVRIPVSILPGTHSQQGYGAEITMTATPVIDSTLLPRVYREFVINDLVDQLAIPLTRFLNTDPNRAAELLEVFKNQKDPRPAFERINAGLDTADRFIIRNRSILLGLGYIANENDFHYSQLNLASGKVLPAIEQSNQESFAADYDHLIDSLGAIKFAVGELNRTLDQTVPGLGGARLNPATAINALDREIIISSAQARQSLVESAGENGRGQFDGIAQGRAAALRVNVWKLINDMQLTETLNYLRNTKTNHGQNLIAARNELAAVVSGLGSLDSPQIRSTVGKLAVTIDSVTAAFEAFIATVDLPTASTRRSMLPFPPRHLPANIGNEQLADIAIDAHDAFRQDIINRQVVHLTDVQAFLREELSAAYNLLEQPQWADLWNLGHMFEPSLAEAIRLREESQIRQIRDEFMAHVRQNSTDDTTSALAWCIYVDAVLLNQQMNKSVAETLGNGVCADGMYYEFFHPQPTPETSEIFAQYVSARWPIRIFTVDPVNTEQNIVDTSSVFRQMQLAVSLAFASGQVSASAALQTLRMIQRDIATVDLNRTVVGFSHGNDTFGWRFYPRFQTPPVESNARVFFRDLLVGGPTDKQLLRSRTIEPGMRECVAIVIMPSFVSDVTIDTHSNWFRLDKPGATALSNSETIKLSRSIQAMRHNAQACVCNEHLYRDGEVQRLLRRVDQLDRELPLQTLACQLPVENSLGGFEILAAGTRELAPELLGWYGSPGYNSETGGQFFLAGDNFSIHETRLIAGNSVIPTSDVEILSRQIISVTLPPGLPVIADEHLPEVAPGDYAGYVDLHLATPYGVSGHMLLPTLSNQTNTSRVTQPTLTSLITEFDLDITQNNNAFSITRVTPRAVPLVSIELPTNSPLASRPLTVTITPQSEDGLLMPIVLNNLRASGSTVNADGGAVIEAVTGSNGSVRQSLADYVTWRLQQPSAGQTIDLTISASLLDGERLPSTPVNGTSTFRLHLNVTNASGN